MPIFTHIKRGIFCLLLITSALGIPGGAVTAQSQEPKPAQSEATPPVGVGVATPIVSTAVSGLSDASWQGPTWQVRIDWNPDVWAVESEFIDAAYEGLQLGSSDSTVYVEAYEGFAGSAEECLAEAEREIAERPNTREVAPLESRPFPEAIDENMAAQMFGVLADLPDGTIYRGAEYVACRTLQPGVAVLETTWQTGAARFNDELPLVRELLAALIVPGDAVE